MSKRLLAVTAAAVAAVAALVVIFATTTGEPVDSGAPTEPPAAGWRWESYGGVEVQVPDDWGHGTTGTPPCMATDQKQEPYVGRPGPVALIACDMDVPPLEARAPYLWFDSRDETGERAYDNGWVEETRVVGGLSLTVFSDDAALRTRILDSARASTDEDCPAEHAVTTGPEARPDPGTGGLATMTTVESVAICRYSLDDEQPLSSGQLTGVDAQAVVQAILAAPEGEGPNAPDSCVPEVAYGDEVLLLTVRDRDSDRAQEVFVRYSGCDGHGIDDGQTRRQLTADTLKPLLAGPHMPSMLSGEVGQLLWG